MAEMKHQIRIVAPPRQVFASLTTQQGLKAWWTSDAIADERAGGKAEFGFDKRTTVFRMRILTLEPDRCLVWSCDGDHPEWKGTTLTWDLTADRDGTILRFAHSNWQSASEYYAMCNSTWGELMYRLKDYLE